MSNDLKAANLKAALAATPPPSIRRTAMNLEIDAEIIDALVRLWPKEAKPDGIAYFAEHGQFGTMIVGLFNSCTDSVAYYAFVGSGLAWLAENTKSRGVWLGPCSFMEKGSTVAIGLELHPMHHGRNELAAVSAAVLAAAKEYKSL